MPKTTTPPAADAVLTALAAHPGKVAIERKVLKDAGIQGDASFAGTAMKGRLYTWSGGETLPELLARREEILARHADAMARARGNRRNLPLIEVLSEALDEDDDTTPCHVCAL